MTYDESVHAAAERVVATALDEDFADGPDLTTLATVAPTASGAMRMVPRAPGVVCGLALVGPVLAGVVERVGGEVSVDHLAMDGDRVARGETLAVLRGTTATLLQAERTLLNLVGQLSGVATATAAWVDAIEGTGARVRDSRKTVPGLRALQKWAVRCGGGVNHRRSLGDEILVKDNHVAAAGSMTAAVTAALRVGAERRVAVEVECDTEAQVREALAAGARALLLDNMGPDELRGCVEAARAVGATTEASGGLTLERAREAAATGVDFLAVGALTHSAPVLDVGLDA